MKMPLVAAGFLLLLRSAVALEPAPPIEWTDQIYPGMGVEELLGVLRGRGEIAGRTASGLTYDTRIHADSADYLFCGDRLYGVVQGGFMTGREFNEWTAAFVEAHARYGEPAEYVADQGLLHFRATWNFGTTSRLHFSLRHDFEDRHGWSRELHYLPVAELCLGGSEGRI